MSAAPAMRLSVSLEDAKAILATEPVGTERYALANSIVSLHAAVVALNAVIESQETEITDAKAAVRRAQDKFDDQSDVVEQLRKELGR